MELDNNISCGNFTLDTSTSSKVLPPKIATRGKAKLDKEIVEQESDPICLNLISTSSSSTTSFTQAFNTDCLLCKKKQVEAPNVEYELSLAKAVMQQYSTFSGDNLFDHLSDIIKRVIDERPPNVIDFFEEFSRNVREQKFHLPERFPPDGIYKENRMHKVAKRVLMSMKLPYQDQSQEFGDEEDVSLEVIKEAYNDEFGILLDDSLRLFITFNERVQQLQFYWNQCGFNISTDDVYQLACAMDRLQTHPSIMQCRFWGCINGLKSSYYIVEALLTRDEISSRVIMMEEEMRERQLPLKMRHKKDGRPDPPHVGPELTPGINGWETYSPDELAKMKPKAAPVPLSEETEFFDIPPEYIGLGCNRFSYFVVNSLFEDWMELPVVTPKQIVVSRLIKKFFTGDLESEIVAYPCFPGKEKHYLRAMIARITAGTYIAPQGYYRKMTKKEKRLYDGGEMEGEEEEEEEEEENAGEGEGDETVDNDVMLLKNERYEVEPLIAISSCANWQHVRPNILRQGRVVWFDEEKAGKEREKALARYLKMLMAEEMEEEMEEEEAEEEEEGEEEGMLEGFIQPEKGPQILNSCDDDISDEHTVPWVSRFTSKYTNRKERVLLLQSNIWPGAFTFTFENICESVYLGWGHKYVSRNAPLKHIPAILEQYPHHPEDFIEASDPSIEEEEAYRQWLLKKQKKHDEGGEDIIENDDEEFAGQYDDDDDNVD